MAPKLRRLIADHAALHEELPPNYLFPSEDAQSDDLTQLTTLLAGPQGTPYSQGLWRLHLKMPEDYPKSPPKATFRTRIWHPNVEESTGAVCVDTLKRDWKSTLTLKDVLVTISCLLIYPNPDSALNSAAGALLQEDYDAFARQAKLMTSIHAPVPADLRKAVVEAKTRGEESGTSIPDHDDVKEEEEIRRRLRSRTGTRVQSLTMKKKQTRRDAGEPSQQQHIDPGPSASLSDDENDTENLAIATKENDPSLSPSPVKLAPTSPRKNAHGKRPLSVLTLSTDADPFITDTEDLVLDMDTDTDMNTDGIGMTASERNIAANATTQDRDPCSPQRKSPKLSSSILNRGAVGASAARLHQDQDLEIFEDDPDPLFSPRRRPTGDGKENASSSSSSSNHAHSFKGEIEDPVARKSHNNSNPARDAPTILPSASTPTSTISTSATASATAKPTSSKFTKPASGTRKVSSSMKKAKPRIGIRRL